MRRRGYECCGFRGSISALDSATGRRLWQTYIIPATDAKRKRIHIGTGNAYTRAATDLNDAVVALDIATGTVAWSHQDTPEDVWLLGCKPGFPGCAAKVGPDADFSASIILKTMSNGREIPAGGSQRRRGDGVGSGSRS